VFDCDVRAGEATVSELNAHPPTFLRSRCSCEYEPPGGLPAAPSSGIIGIDHSSRGQFRAIHKAGEQDLCWRLGRKW